MRRFLLLLGITLVLIGIKMSGSLMVMKNFRPDAEYVFYLASSEVSVPIAEAKNMRSGLRGIKGEAVRFTGQRKDIDGIVDYLDGAVIRTETVGNILIVYGYSPKLGNAVTLASDRINFQIAVSDGVITVGSPLIAGSY